MGKVIVVLCGRSPRPFANMLSCADVELLVLGVVYGSDVVDLMCQELCLDLGHLPA
jgi:hypothetical protein